MADVFPGDDVARLVPENVRSVLDDLKKTPVDYPKWIYGFPRDEVYQGDILQHTVVYALSTSGTIVSREGPAIVISHTCDCQPNQSNSVLVAPLFGFNELMPDEDFTVEEIVNFKRDLCGNRLKAQVFFPAINGMPDSCLDLGQVFSVSARWFHSDGFVGGRKRLASLSQKGHYFFLMRLGYYLGRPDPVDSKRSPVSLNEEIRQRAYEIYIARGRADGFALNDWLKAENEVIMRSK